MNTLRKGPNNGTNPLADDTNAMLRRHPGLKVTFGMAEHDPLYLNPETCQGSAYQLLGNLAVQQADVRAIIIPGMTHTINTYFPSLYHNVKKYAVTR